MIAILVHERRIDDNSVLLLSLDLKPLGHLLANDGNNVRGYHCCLLPVKENALDNCGSSLSISSMIKKRLQRYSSADSGESYLSVAVAYSSNLAQKLIALRKFVNMKRVSRYRLLF